MADSCNQPFNGIVSCSSFLTLIVFACISSRFCCSFASWCCPLCLITFWWFCYVVLWKCWKTLLSSIPPEKNLETISFLSQIFQTRRSLVKACANFFIFLLPNRNLWAILVATWLPSYVVNLEPCINFVVEVCGHCLKNSHYASHLYVWSGGQCKDRKSYISWNVFLTFPSL